MFKQTVPQPRPLQLDRDFSGRQIVGTRDEQQDSYAFSILEGSPDAASRLLVVVADGMGGHIGGREASLAAVDGFVDAFLEASGTPEDASKAGGGVAQPPPLPLPAGASGPDSPAPSDDPGHKSSGPGGIAHETHEKNPHPSRESEADERSSAEAPSILKVALLAANAAVDSMIVADPDKFLEAGTTLLAAVVNRHSIQWISVGDSPLLLWRRDKLARLNADHSMRAALAAKVAARQMRAADVATHPERNALLAVLNGLEISEIDEPPHPTNLQPGDIVIAASDGLLTLADGDISKELARLRKEPALVVVRALLEKIEKKSNPKQDNTTVAIIKI